MKNKKNLKLVHMEIIKQRKYSQIQIEYFIILIEYFSILYILYIFIELFDK